MGKFDARLNRIEKKLSDPKGTLLCTCQAIRVFETAPDGQDPETPQWKCKMHPKQINTIMIHHAQNPFADEEGREKQEVESFPERGGESSNEGRGGRQVVVG
jgi:hypothetical protein